MTFQSPLSKTYYSFLYGGKILVRTEHATMQWKDFKRMNLKSNIGKEETTKILTGYREDLPGKKLL